MNKSLFEIQSDYLAIANELANSEGELSPELESRLSIHHQELKAKSLAYVQVMALIESDIAFAQQEMERIGTYIKGKQRLRERLRERLTIATLEYGEIHTGTYQITTRKSESVEVDLNQIPEAYTRILVHPIADKAKIKEALKAGENVPGARLVIKHNLIIK